MYQKIEGAQSVRRIDDGATIPPGHWMWEEYQAWLADGNTPSDPPPPYLPNTPEHYRAIREAAWAWMTSVVQARRYDSIETCCSYANSGVPRYRAEALAMIAWRDAINQRLEQLVMAPPKGLTTWEQVRELLPHPETFAWPEDVDIPLSVAPPADPSE